MKTIADVIDYLYSLFNSHPIGGFAASIPLSSGIDIAKERAAARDKLKKACNDIVSMPELHMVGDVTYCNVAVQLIAKRLGCTELDHMTANQMVDFLEKSDKWRKDNGERAASHAENGGLAVAAKQYYQHGHIAVIYPYGTLGFSGSWNKLVPYVANVGKMNAIIKVSEAFPVTDDEPFYFLRGEV